MCVLLLTGWVVSGWVSHIWIGSITGVYGHAGVDFDFVVFF